MVRSKLTARSYFIDAQKFPSHQFIQTSYPISKTFGLVSVQLGGNTNKEN